MASSTASRRPRELAALGHVERNAGLADLVLGAHQTLRHRRRRDQEGRADGGGVEPEDGLENERRADGGIDRGMRAGEHQGQTLVGHRRLARGGGFDLVRHQLEMIGGLHATAPAPAGVDLLPPRHGQEPRFGSIGDALVGPLGERRREGFRERVLRAGDVARASRQQGDELAVAPPRHRFGGVTGSVLALSRHHSG